MKKIILPTVLALTTYGAYRYIKKHPIIFPKKVRSVPIVVRGEDIYVGDRRLYAFFITKGDYSYYLQGNKDVKQCGFDLNIEPLYANMQFKEIILPRLKTGLNHHIRADVLASYREDGIYKIASIKELNLDENSDVRERRITEKDIKTFADTYNKGDFPGVITVRFHIVEEGTYREIMTDVTTLDKTIFIFEPIDAESESGRFVLNLWFRGFNTEETLSYELAHHFGDYQ